MKKTILIGALATAFMITGGTGLYMASAKDIPSNDKITTQMGNMMGTSHMMESGSFDEMHKYMEEGNMNFGQMKGFMSEMHPDLDTQELEEMYKSMHGTGGASQSRHFK